jgi:ABC-type Fe3+ transport system substrate-binding protein
VFLVDREMLGNLPMPGTWADLLDPRYANRLVVSGKNDVVNDAVLLTLFKDFGEEGLRRLARNVMAVGSYSKVVNEMAGRKDRPAVYAIPYYFARNALAKKEMEIIWPEDGAILDPVYMLVKKSGFERTGVITSYLTGRDFGKLSADMGFPVPFSDVDNGLPEGAGFRWLGWDFIRGNDIHTLKSELSGIYLRARPN